MKSFRLEPSDRELSFLHVYIGVLVAFCMAIVQRKFSIAAIILLGMAIFYAFGKSKFRWVKIFGNFGFCLSAGATLYVLSEFVWTSINRRIGNQI